MDAAVVIPAPTEPAALDAILLRLKDGARTWAKLAVRERLLLLRQLRERYAAVAEESVRATCLAKGIDPDSALAGEEWLGGPMIVLRNLRLLEKSLQSIQEHGVPRIDPSWLRTLEDGRLALRLFPHALMDHVLLPLYVAEVYLQPGINRGNLAEHQASFYRKPHDGRLCAVLGAGNVNAIAPTDCLHKLFVEGTACVLKMNPVNAYLGPFLERAFEPLVRSNLFAVVYGGTEVGRALVQHPEVDEAHVTGSDKTYNALVWGPGEEGERRRLDGQAPLLRKPFSAELGNVGPVVVVPGPYTPGQLRMQGRAVAGMVANNASFNCTAAKLLVQSRGSHQREAFLSAVEAGLAQAQVRRAYYPGAAERYRAFTEGRKGLRTVGHAQLGELPFAILPDVDPAHSEDPVFREEPWCTVLAETALPGGEDPVAFLEQVVPFLNEKVWGTLCATLIVHPTTLKDPRARAALEQALRSLRYGAVAVNAWVSAVFGLANLPWGGHPSSSSRDIQSGQGFVHNVWMLECVEKVVVRAPLAARPAAPWAAGHRGLLPLGRGLSRFEAHPSWSQVPALAWAALRA